jgi:hypothetical protein
MAHPAGGLQIDTLEKSLRFPDLQLGQSVFSLSRSLNTAFQSVHHELETVADAEDRDTQIKNPLIGFGAVRVVYT